MARILGIPVREDIETVNEHSIEYGLEDNWIDRFNELREELRVAISEGRLEPQQNGEQENDQTSGGQAENQPESQPEPEPEKTPEQLAEERVKDLVELMRRIKTADDMSKGKQEELNRKIEEMRNETRPVVVDELRAEVAKLEADKKEFDEMTAESYANAKEEARRIQEESEKAYNDKLVEFLNRRQEIERKLKVMRSRGLEPEKMASAERLLHKKLLMH